MSDATSAFFGLDPPERFGNGDFLFVNAFGNSTAIDTGEGLVLFDVGLEMSGERLFKAVREFSADPVVAIIISHGHFDHAFGFGPFIEEILINGWEMPKIFAHENLPRRVQKYRRLEPYHQWINAMQFSAIVRGKREAVVSTRHALEPTTLVNDGEPVSFSVGRYTFELYPSWGETDDALWCHVPAARTILAGDLVVSSFPNVGNPYKVQRYPLDWARAMDAMVALGCEVLAPGHGALVKGEDRVRECLTITAEALRFVHDAVVSRMNERKWFPDIYREVIDTYPDRFKDSEFLQPIYGDPRFAIHATHRLYHGWYASGNPTDLFPAPKEDVAMEILGAIGESAPATLLARATSLLEDGKAQLAMHLIDVLLDGRQGTKNMPEIEAATRLKVKALKSIARHEPSFIARNILENEARALKERAGSERKGP